MTWGLAALGVAAFALATREAVGREAWRRATTAAEVAAARAALLPDAGLVVLPLDGEDPAVLRRALALRPRDPRLLAALAAAAPDPLDDAALASAVRASAVAPYAGGVADATTSRLLAAGEELAAAAVLWRDRVRRAAASARPDREELALEAARTLARARAVLGAVLAVDAALSPTTPGRAPVTERAAVARRRLAELEEAP
ncbi:MAG: hypothetical protein JNM10_11840 [Planctomycetia bacterium]|nr:hypothetical protein [Planctomycetia bacterium]